MPILSSTVCLIATNRHNALIMRMANKNNLLIAKATRRLPSH